MGEQKTYFLAYEVFRNTNFLKEALASEISHSDIEYFMHNGSINPPSKEAAKDGWICNVESKDHKYKEGVRFCPFPEKDETRELREESKKLEEEIAAIVKDEENLQKKIKGRSKKGKIEKELKEFVANKRETKIKLYKECLTN